LDSLIVALGEFGESDTKIYFLWSFTGT